MTTDEPNNKLLQNMYTFSAVLILAFEEIRCRSAAFDQFDSKTPNQIIIIILVIIQLLLVLNASDKQQNTNVYKGHWNIRTFMSFHARKL